MNVIVPQLKIIRLEDNFKYGVFGVLIINSFVYCVTLEPPENENQKNLSCIPQGQYECLKITSPKFGTTYRVEDVPNRNDILFHAGNVKNNTKGCILLAEKFGKLHGDRAILNSGTTFTQFLNDMNYYKRLHLTIIEGW